jgi:hypothetical protein
MMTDQVICEATTGFYGPPTAGSLARSWGCPDVAVVTLEGTCGCGHERRKRLCPKHGNPAPVDGVWLCQVCAGEGHDCHLAVRVVG